MAGANFGTNIVQCMIKIIGASESKQMYMSEVVFKDAHLGTKNVYMYTQGSNSTKKACGDEKRVRHSKGYTLVNLCKFWSKCGW